MTPKFNILVQLLLIGGKDSSCTHQHFPAGAMLNDYALKWRKEFRAKKAALLPEVSLL